MTQVLNSPIASISPLSSLTSSANRRLWSRVSSSNMELRSAQLWETFPRTPCCPGVILQRLLGSNIIICSICTEAVSRNRSLLDPCHLLTCVSPSISSWKSLLTHAPISARRLIPMCLPETCHTRCSLRVFDVLFFTQ